MCIEVEFNKGVILTKEIRPSMPEKEILLYFVRFAKDILYAHQNIIAHRNLKSDNGFLM
jgi:serine/threonine protein kinase